MPSDKTMAASLGALRMQSEIRQLGGMLMVSGICAVITPLGDIAAGSGEDGLIIDTSLDEIPLWSFIGGCCLASVGVGAVLLGFLSSILDAGSKPVTSLFIILAQSAWIPYTTTIVALVKATLEDPPMFFTSITGSGIGMAEEMSDMDVQFIGSMGVAGFVTYGFSLVGTPAFMMFALHAFYAGKPLDRSGSYYAGRLTTYSLLLCIAGVSQLMLGSYIITNFNVEEGKVEGGVFTTGPYVVLFPAVSMAVGAIQSVNGLWGFARSLDVAHGGEDDILYAFSMAFQFLAMVGGQGLLQLSFLPEGFAGSAYGLGAMSLTLCAMPAFLDAKMRALPYTIDPVHYGLEDPNDVDRDLGESPPQQSYTSIPAQEGPRSSQTKTPPEGAEEPVTLTRLNPDEMDV